MVLVAPFEAPMRSGLPSPFMSAKVTFERPPPNNEKGVVALKLPVPFPKSTVGFEVAGLVLSTSKSGLRSPFRSAVVRYWGEVDAIDDSDMGTGSEGSRTWYLS